MKRRFLIPLVLLTAGIVLGVAAYASPVKGLPAKPDCNMEAGGGGTPSAIQCKQSNETWQSLMFVDGPIFYQYQSFGSAALGFVVASALVFVWAAWEPRWSVLERPLMPRFPARLALSLELLSGAVFAAFVLFDASLHAYLLWNTIAPALATKRLAYYGPVAFLAWGSATLLLSFRDGVARALKVWGLPAILFLEIGLLIGLPESMPNHVLDAFQWSVGGIYLVSNWLVLIVASVTTAIAYGYFGAGDSGIAPSHA